MTQDNSCGSLSGMEGKPSSPRSLLLSNLVSSLLLCGILYIIHQDDEWQCIYLSQTIDVRRTLINLFGLGDVDC